MSAGVGSSETRSALKAASCVDPSQFSLGRSGHKAPCLSLRAHPRPQENPPPPCCINGIAFVPFPSSDGSRCPRKRTAEFAGPAAPGAAGAGCASLTFAVGSALMSRSAQLPLLRLRSWQSRNVQADFSEKVKVAQLGGAGKGMAESGFRARSWDNSCGVGAHPGPPALVVGGP